jgi:hypothetical protein
VDKDEEPWMRSITLEGREKRFCPLDPGCRRYLHDVVLMLARGKPCFLLIDDDVHASGTFGVECFCERHVDKFNAENGTAHTSESLRAAVAACHPGDAVCVAFEKLQRSFVDSIVDLVRSALDEVDPTLPAGACTPGLERRYAAAAATRIAAAGQLPVLRIDNAIYLHRTLATFSDMLAYTMAIADWNRGIQYLLDESDTCPHNRWSMSASVLEMKLEAAAFCGLRGSKLWYCNAHKGAFPISRAYTDALSSRRGVCNAIAEVADASELAGIVIPVIGGRAPWHPTAPRESFTGRGDWGSGMAGGFGVPFRCLGDFSGDAIYALGGADAASKLPESELREMFRHRVLVDGSAAAALTARGLSDLMGVRAEGPSPRYNLERDPVRGVTYVFSHDDGTPLLTPLSQDAEIVTQLCYAEFHGSPDVEVVAPGMVAATNVLGGRVVTTAFFAGGYQMHPALTDMRKDWFLLALGELGWNGWAALADQDIALLERHHPDGTTFLAVFNTNFDELATICLRAPSCPQSVEILECGGVWREIGFSRIHCGIELPLRLPCSHACILRMTE